MRDKSKTELINQLNEYKDELANLRVAQRTGGAQSKLAKIKVVRKAIARVLTVYNQTQKSKLRKAAEGQKWKNTDMREKKTRAIRRRLTHEQLTVKATSQPKTPKSGKSCQKRVPRVVPRVAKRAANFPQRVYAVKA